MNPFKLFKIKSEERLQASVVLAVIFVFNALFVWRMHELFMQEGFGPYWKVFERELHLSGYDPLTYLGVTDWDVVYNVYRHPLLAFMIWPLWLLNQGLTAILGVNCVQYLVAVPVMAASFYSYIFLYRIHHGARPLHYLHVPAVADALHLREVHPKGKGVPLVAVGITLLYYGRCHPQQWGKDIPVWTVCQSEGFLPSEVSVARRGSACSTHLGSGHIGV